MKDYAAFASVPEAIARDTRDKFFPKAAIAPDRISGLQSVMDDAVRSKSLFGNASRVDAPEQ